MNLPAGPCDVSCLLTCTIIIAVLSETSWKKWNNEDKRHFAHHLPLGYYPASQQLKCAPEDPLLYIPLTTVLSQFQGSYISFPYKIQGLFTDHFVKFQGPNLLLLIYVPNKLWIYSSINGLLFLRATNLMKTRESITDFHFLNADFILLALNYYLPKFFKDHNEWKRISRTFKALKGDSKIQRCSRRVQTLQFKLAQLPSGLLKMVAFWCLIQQQYLKIKHLLAQHFSL